MENFRDAELKKWLAEEYEKETEEMEKILFPDGVIPDDGETEEEAKAAYQRLVERLKADGVYKEDETDSIKTDDHKENVKIVYLPEKKSHKAARVAAAVLVCSAGIFAASMTSQANRSYFLDSVRYWAGDDTKIVAGDADTKNTGSTVVVTEGGSVSTGGTEWDIEQDLPKDVPPGLNSDGEVVDSEAYEVWVQASHQTRDMTRREEVNINHATDKARDFDDDREVF